MKLKLFLIIPITFVFLNTANAQADTVGVNPAKLSLAHQLIDLTGSVTARYKLMRSDYIKSIGEAAHVPDKNLPKFQSQMTAFFDKYQPMDNYKDTFANIYAHEFTEQELKQLVDFYNSPTGKKILAKLPAIMQQSMLLSQNVFKAHFDEIQSIVTDAMKE